MIEKFTNSTKLLCVAGVALLVIWGGYELFKRTTMAPKEVAQCRKQIKEELIAPSTFKIVDESNSTSSVTPQDYISAMMENDVRRLARAQDENDEPTITVTRRLIDVTIKGWDLWLARDYKKKVQPNGGPFLRSVYIIYEAQNSFGVPIRSVRTCRFYALTKNGEIESDGLHAQRSLSDSERHDRFRSRLN